jgi:hypothetical protein
MNEYDRIETVQKFAVHVVNLFEEPETVYIIVDRVERRIDSRKGADHRKVLLKALVGMVEGAKCNLKILAIINGYDWRVEERRDEFGTVKKGTVIIHTW